MPRFTPVRILFACVALATLGFVFGPSFSTAETVKEKAPYTFLNGFVRETPMKVSAGYVAIQNNTDKDDALVDAKATWAGRVELHNVTADADGTMAMKQVNSITLPAHGELVLKPGSYHLMIYDLKEPLKLSEEKVITLILKNGGTHDVTFTVQPIAYQGQRADAGTAKGHDMHHGHHAHE